LKSLSRWSTKACLTSWFMLCWDSGGQYISMSSKRCWILCDTFGELDSCTVHVLQLSWSPCNVFVTETSVACGLVESRGVGVSAALRVFVGPISI
jgi:hypothetical protein